MAGQPAAEFAGLLQRLRAEAGLTQEGLAEAARLSPRTVSDLERGIHRSAQQDTARLLAEALGLAGPVRGLFVAAARGQASAAEVLAARSGSPRDVAGVAGRQADVEPLPGPVAVSPYRGLTAFGEQDAPFFFGREAAASQVLERLARLLAGTGLLVVSGVSGAGKSSLLQAGVLPQLRKAGLVGAPGAALWPCLVFTPTRAPLDELALRLGLLAGADAASVRRGLDVDPAGFALTARQAALMRPPRLAGEPEGSAAEAGQRRVVLVVDQFEQVFTLCADEGQRQGFITALHAAATAGQGSGQAPAGLVVLGVRADFEARCADYPPLAGAVQDRYLVTPMTGRQLRMAITEPAKKAGAAIDADLVEVLLAEARAGEPAGPGAGALPFLSLALDQAWQYRTSDTVTLADYERADGVEGAVASSAQRVYESLSPAQQTVARQVFVRLAATSGDRVNTADRVTLAELTEGKSAAQAHDVAEVVEAFAAERLLIRSADGVEISHEVVLSAWPLLRDTWLADIREYRIVRTRLRHAAAEWARHSRDPSYLYGGSLLAVAVDMAARIGADPVAQAPLSQTERDFLNASGRARRSRTRRRRALVASLIALVVGFGAVTALAVRVLYEAAHLSATAISQQLISQSHLLSSANPVLAKLLSVEAWRLNHSTDARYAMLAAARLPEHAVLSHRTGPVAFTPRGNLLASDNVKGNVWLWDVANNRPDGLPLTAHAGLVISVAFSPTGNLLATGSSAGMTQLWDVANRRPRGGPLGGHDGPVNAVAFSPDGATLATGYGDGTVKLWNVNNDYRPFATLNGHGSAVLSLAFSPTGNLLAAGYGNGTVQLWNANNSYRPFATLKGHGGPVNAVAFRPFSETMATGTGDGTVRLWNANNIHRPFATLNGHDGVVLSVAFSPKGNLLATGSSAGVTRLWDVAARHWIGGPLTGHTGFVFSVAFSPDGRTLATGGEDDTVRLWDVAANGPIEHSLTGYTGPALVRDLCASAGRSLTRSEWAHYLPGRPYQRVCR